MDVHLELLWPLDMKAPSLHGRRPVITATFPDHEARHSTASGLDIGVDQGTPVLAAAAGRAYLDQNPVSGLAVRIRHLVAGQVLETLYCHLSQFNVVNGQEVAAGDVVGLSGSTGRSTGPHVHFAVCLVTHDARHRERRWWFDPAPILPAV